MEKYQAIKYYLCKLCDQRFSDGMKYRGHIRGHMALFSGSIKQSTIEHDQETINGEQSEERISRIEKSLVLDEDNEAIICRQRENPKKSWRNSVSNSNSVCKQCGKGFKSMKHLEKHMKFHSPQCKESVKKFHPYKNSTSSSMSSPVSTLSPLEESKLGELGKGVIFSPIKRKRSCRMHKSANPNYPSCSASLSPSVTVDEEMKEVALCLIMLSRGPELDGGKMVISANQEVGLSVDMSFKKEISGEYGSAYANMNTVNRDLWSNSQNVVDKGKRKVYDDQSYSDLRISKKYKCSVDGSILRFKKVDIGPSGSGHNANDTMSNDLRSYYQTVRDEGKRKVYDDQCDTNIWKLQAYNQ